jgi:hypothetical protein
MEFSTNTHSEHGQNRTFLDVWRKRGRICSYVVFFFSPFTEERCSKGRNDSLAMKGAGNELKGMIRFMEAARKVRGIYTPLMALIDYHGFEFFNPFSF